MANKVRLLDQIEVVYQALRALGPGWHTRKEITVQLGTKMLSAYNVAALEVLAASGRISAESRPIDGRTVVRWEYRINERKAE
jgi:hypothetical protein